MWSCHLPAILRYASETANGRKPLRVSTRCDGVLCSSVAASSRCRPSSPKPMSMTSATAAVARPRPIWDSLTQ